MRIEQAAREHIDKQLTNSGLSDPQVELSVVSARPAPACGAPVEIEALDARQYARMRFVARCPDPRGWRHDFVVRARVSAQVAVTAMPLRAGEVLSDDHITLERRDVTAVNDAIGAPESAVGQTSRRSLRAGEVLRSSQLAAPIMVKRGDQVLMQARYEGVEVSMAGEALDAGARGAMVRVRNAASGQVLRMRVSGAGTVEPADLPGVNR
ncbi:flagellar basal body P-ring formation chaperone FlgA [Massilia yuzhufengensis]|uniref:flagellar basal body P-ring formation chaperone FlgA n=1 Tax=Massilia yuzhufengensis TaxID=1164594 RepID=UPI001E2A9C1E|nr:flagellar basal body P-ring formation chaperone FlgA [Massilia yuzhufengensis]